jgi:hypothetical protein
MQIVTIYNLSVCLIFVLSYDKSGVIVKIIVYCAKFAILKICLFLITIIK